MKTKKVKSVKKIISAVLLSAVVATFVTRYFKDSGALAYKDAVKFVV